MRIGTVCLASLAVTFGVAQGADRLWEPIQGYEKIEVTEFRNKVGENLSSKVISDLGVRVVKAINESKLIAADSNADLKFPKKSPSDEAGLARHGRRCGQ